MTSTTTPNDAETGQQTLTDITTDTSSNTIDTTPTITQADSIDPNYSLVLSDDVIETMFKKIDLNCDGLIDIHELKAYLHTTDTSHLPKGFAREVLRRADKNDDEAISFDEFLKLCRNDSWLTNQTFLNFCELITLPIKNRRKRVRYEDMMSCSPIPVVIIIVSFLEIIFFINDQRSIRQHIYHIGSNLFLQLVSGIPLESVHGWWRILIIYLASVLAGSVGVESVSNCNALVGSSAGAYGLLGAHFSTLIMNWNEMDHKFIRLLIVGVYVAVDVVICLNLSVNGFTNSTITHLCGFIIGFLVGNVLIKNLVAEDYEKTIWLVSSILVGLLFSTGIFLIVFIPN